MRTIAIIPARGGSKRLPRKNVTPVLGKPLLAWAIEAAQASRFVSPGGVFVSTDDPEIAQVARVFGAGVVRRPPELAGDEVWTEPVIQHAVEQVEAQSQESDLVIWMNACGPEVTAGDVDRAVDLLLAENLREVFSVDAAGRSNSIVRVLKRETLFQRRLSAKCGVIVLDYVDIHRVEDIAQAEQRLMARGQAAAAAGAGRKQSMVLDDSAWSHKAWMSCTDADLLERIILRLTSGADGPLQVVEWGSGRSSLYFTSLLQSRGIAYHWLSLEYDRDYFTQELEATASQRPECSVLFIDQDGTQHVRQQAGGPAEYQLAFVVFDAGRVQPYLEGREADRQADLDAYVCYPAGLGRRFDFMLVDGRKRRRCLLEAANLLKDNGLAVLHDAYRWHYQCAFQQFRSQRMLGEVLWVGSTAQTDFLAYIT